MTTNEQSIAEPLLGAGTEQNHVERRSLWALLWGILVRPRRTWAYLSQHDRQGWWILLLLLLALTLPPSALSWSFEKSAQTSITPSMMEYEKYGYVEPPPRSSGINVAGLALHIVGQAAGTAFSWVLWATALYLISVFWGRSSSFGRMFRLTLWAWIPYALRSSVQLVYLLISKRPIWNRGLSGFVIDRSTAAAALIPPGPGQVALASVLGHIDLFWAWSLFLLITGLIVFTRLKTKRAVLAVLLIWALLVLLGLIPAIIGSSLSQVGVG
ncbi:MAG: YIP1 family protein [Anaerolineae bacterium]|nr:YIP1 family protein [Anaerolineae bacterium]